MAYGMLHSGGDVYVGHESDDSYLLYLSGENTQLQLGRGVDAEDGDKGGLTLSGPHTPTKLFVSPTAEVVHSDGRRVPLLPIIRRLLADPTHPQPVFTE